MNVVWAKYSKGIFWPAKIINGKDKGKWKKLINFFDEDSVKPFTKRINTCCWGCCNQELYISEGEKLENIDRRLSFKRALKIALQQSKGEHKLVKGESTDAKTSADMNSKDESNESKQENKSNCNNQSERKRKHRCPDQLQKIGKIKKRLNRSASTISDASNGTSCDNVNDSLETERSAPDQAIIADVLFGQNNNFPSTPVSDDEDDDLPIAFSPVKKTPDTYVEGDLIWAKFKKHPYWPALFHSLELKTPRKLRSSISRANVWFFDETWKIVNLKRRPLEVPVNRIVPYCCDPYVRNQFLKDGKEFNSLHNFENCIKYAEDYINLKAAGKMADFFHYQDEAENDDEVYTTKITRPKKKLKEENVLKFKDLLTKKRTLRKTTTRKKHHLLLCALERTRPLLVKIFNKEVKCERHEAFLRGTAREKDELKYKSGFGPIDDDCLSEEIIDNLVGWFIEDVKRQTTIHPVSYVSDVWLPEAMVLAIMDSRKVDRETAEQMYFTGS